ncbi:unnamed protein product, partial [Adineta steineri]
ADCYDEVTVSNIGRYFQNLLSHIFSENTKTIGFEPIFEKTGNLSLLPMDVENLSNVIESLRHFSEIKPASYAQHRIWLDEERRLYLNEPQLATYNMVFCYRLSADHTLSVQQLRYALHLVVDKHQSLRTSFIFDTTKNILTQRIADQQNHENNRFSIVESIYETDEQLDEIIHNETHNPHIFDLAQGLVFRCHLVHYIQVSIDDLIFNNDIIIFNFHQASFDDPSMKIFLHDLHQAYTTSQLPNDDSTNRLRYLDYTVIEQRMPMIGASMFWNDALHNHKLDQSLSLPYDRYRPTNDYQSGFGTSVSFDLDRDLCDTFLQYTSSQNISLEHLALSMYFVFLFKLTNGETDLCIGMSIDGRYRDELRSVIGMFVNAIPLRCQLDPQWCLHKLVKHVQEILTNSRKYSYFPLRRLLDQHPHALKPAFLDTSFEFMQYPQQDLVMKHPQKLAVELDEQSLTYCELLHYVQVLSFTLLNEYHVLPGDIVCQCVERSLSMVIGIMGIEMAGGIYCPLSPRDPRHRVQALIEQTKCRLVLAHHSTMLKFSSEIVLCNIDLIWTINHINGSIILDRLSDIVLTADNIAYIVFTSGSTGKSKGVQIRHRNFLACIDSLVRLNLFPNKGILIQMASCSFDVHVEEIIGALITSSTIIMLGPQGNMDLKYMIKTLNRKQVSYLSLVPSYANILVEFLESHSISSLNNLRIVAIGGEASTVQLIDKLYTYLPQDSFVWNGYGPSEITVDSTIFVIRRNINMTSIPMGRPLLNYRCMIMNEYLQSSVRSEEGELFLGGVGVFAGYLGRDDLTAKALLEIDGQLFYRTGDLVRMDNNGLLHYQGRKDHQIKLHGQRIELGEIERCLLNITSISACVVMKWKDDYLVAYVQSSDINEKQLREHCQSYLPPQMIPSLFVILDKLPLNANGKIDRKLLPPPDFLSLVSDYSSNKPSTNVEQQLQKIFSQAFRVESPPIDVSFGQLGGTSLDAIHALTLIRQQVHTNIDIGLLFANPSIRQLAIAVEPLLISNQSQETVFTVNQSHETYVHLAPSFVVESIGVIVLFCQWLWPIIIIHQWCPLFFPFLPAFHLIFYAICSRLFSLQNNKTDIVFSWNYYRWWFLDRLWNNNTFWLQHILGTPFYNYYLRLCGAHISTEAHIYTTAMDAPWLVEIDDGTWIADQTLLNCFHFNGDNTFKLYPIRIGSNCSVGTRSILFDGINMQNNIIVQPMSSVTGSIASRTVIDGEEHKPVSSNDSMTHSNRSLSLWHKIYQIVVLISLICIHYTILIFVYKIYSIKQISLPISIAFCWTLWSIIGCFVSVVLLKYVVGSCAAGDTYSIASWSYLHKLWIRQLIVSSFRHAWLLPSAYDDIYPFVLRWLGAHIEDNVKLYDIGIFLSYPTNLLKLETGITVFGYVLLVPTEMTLSGDHRVDRITLEAHANLANRCSILPGSHLASETMVGNLTRISREINSKQGDVFIGVPARVMPFKMPLRSNITDQIENTSLWHTCFWHFISKCLLINIYSLGGFIGGPIIHITLICSLCRRNSSIRYELVQPILGRLTHDCQQFMCPFISNTQWLIRLFRRFGAHIGKGVVLPDFSCITFYHLITIGDNVRLNMHANIQCHSFEQRILKLAPVTIGNSCVLMSGSYVMAGCKLMGNNKLYPFTLIMKNDQLSPNTHWKGLPAQSCTVKAKPSRPTIVHDDLVKYQQGYETINKLFLWYEQIASIYTSLNELQFMNYGYADMDEYIDDHTGYYSRKLYEQVLASVTVTDKKVLEINCGRGAGAAWYVHNHAFHSYIGIDRSQDIINLCQRLYSTTPRLSFVVADATKHLPLENESIDIILCIQATHAFDEPKAITQFANEAIRVLRPNGYLLWCDFCYINGSGTSVYDLIASDELII